MFTGLNCGGNLSKFHMNLLNIQYVYPIISFFYRLLFCKTCQVDHPRAHTISFSNRYSFNRFKSGNCGMYIGVMQLLTLNVGVA